VVCGAGAHHEPAGHLLPFPPETGAEVAGADVGLVVVGALVGFEVGAAVVVGALVGFEVGALVAFEVGAEVGRVVGAAVAALLHERVVSHLMLVPFLTV